MRTILLFLPYGLIPLLVNVVICKNDIPRTGLTFIIYLLFFLVYPFITIQLDEHFNPQTPKLSCGMPVFGWILFNWFAVIPFLFVEQAIINFILININLTEKENNKIQ